ncbi:hypothetical protein C0J52_08966 [Blattella germanica]|nr:hypothetical protein C0J52_08966 [Blattella germanica]
MFRNMPRIPRFLRNESEIMDAVNEILDNVCQVVSNCIILRQIICKYFSKQFMQIFFFILFCYFSRIFIKYKYWCRDLILICFNILESYPLKVLQVFCTYF